MVIFGEVSLWMKRRPQLDGPIYQNPPGSDCIGSNANPYHPLFTFHRDHIHGSFGLLCSVQEGVWKEGKQHILSSRTNTHLTPGISLTEQMFIIK